MYTHTLVISFKIGGGGRRKRETCLKSPGVAGKSPKP